MKYHPVDTLSAILAAPQMRHLDLSHLPVSYLAKASKLALTQAEADGVSDPIAEAVQFYCLNHLVSVLKRVRTPHEKLKGVESLVAGMYGTTLQEYGNRLLHYMLLITTREARHLHTPSATLNKQITSLYGPEMMEFISKIRTGHEGGAITLYSTQPPAASSGRYIGALCHVYYSGKWSVSYGGPAWGAIADTVKNFLTGKTTQEMLIDTAYTLAHNTAPMFNKGMLYDNPSAHKLIRVLDVQRSGQIPELVCQGTDPGTQSLQGLVNEFRKYHPNEFGTSVDWYKVEALGALGKYAKEKEQQKALTPPPPPPPETYSVGHFKAKKVGMYNVMPHKTAVILEREGV